MTATFADPIDQTQVAVPLTAPELQGLSGIRHGFFSRRGGVSEGLYAGLNTGLGSNDNRDALMENRRRVAAHFDLPVENLLSLHQVHSRDVVTVTEPWQPGFGPKCDGAVTIKPGLALGASAADCGPVLFADPQAKVVGAAHAGWRGAFLDIISAMADAMEALGAERSRIIAVLGPTISQANYEVGPEFVERFLDANPQFDRFFRRSDRTDHAQFDLPAFIEFRAKNAGIGTFRRMDLCTYADDTMFFSYRRSTHREEPDYGRMISAIALSE